MKRIAALLITALAMAAQAQSHRFPPIDLYTGDPTGVACSVENSLVQSSTNGSVYSCHNGFYAGSGSATAAGLDTQIQRNCVGSFCGGAATLDSSGNLSAASAAVSGQPAATDQAVSPNGYQAFVDARIYGVRADANVSNSDPFVWTGTDFGAKINTAVGQGHLKLMAQPGSYVTSSEITPVSGLRIVCAVPKMCILYSNFATGSKRIYGSPAGPVSGGEFSGFTIMRTGNHAEHGILTENLNHWIFRDLVISGRFPDGTCHGSDTTAYPPTAGGATTTMVGIAFGLSTSFPNTNPSTDITIDNVSIDCGGNGGIQIGNVTGYSVKGGYIKDTSREALAAEPTMLSYDYVVAADVSANEIAWPGSTCAGKCLQLPSPVQTADPIYHSDQGTVDAGFGPAHGTVYYAIASSPGHIKLAATREQALQGIAITLGTPASTHLLMSMGQSKGTFSGVTVDTSSVPVDGTYTGSIIATGNSGGATPGVVFNGIISRNSNLTSGSQHFTCQGCQGVTVVGNTFRGAPTDGIQQSTGFINNIIALDGTVLTSPSDGWPVTPLSNFYVANTVTGFGLVNTVAATACSMVASTNTATIYTASNLLYSSEPITVSGFGGACAFLNGAGVTISASSSTLTVSATHADLAQTSDTGLVTSSPTGINIRAGSAYVSENQVSSAVAGVQGISLSAAAGVAGAFEGPLNNVSVPNGTARPSTNTYSTPIFSGYSIVNGSSTVTWTYPSAFVSDYFDLYQTVAGVPTLRFGIKNDGTTMTPKIANPLGSVVLTNTPNTILDSTGTSNSMFIYARGATTANSLVKLFSGASWTHSSGVMIGMSFIPTINETSGAGSTILNCSPVQTALGSGKHYCWSTGAAGSETSTIDFSGNAKFASMLVPLSTPASSAATCTAGQMWADATFMYVCTATNTIKRITLVAF